MNANKHATPTGWVDPDDAPELTDEFFQQADELNGEKLVRRGRPKAAARIDAPGGAGVGRSRPASPRTALSGGRAPAQKR